LRPSDGYAEHQNRLPDPPCPPNTHTDRYTDAVKMFNTVLGYINRVKQYHSRSAQYEQILKKNEQM
jgi:hypothetical protein